MSIERTTPRVEQLLALRRDAAISDKCARIASIEVPGTAGWHEPKRKSLLGRIAKFADVRPEAPTRLRGTSLNRLLTMFRGVDYSPTNVQQPHENVVSFDCSFGETGPPFVVVGSVRDALINDCTLVAKFTRSLDLSEINGINSELPWGRLFNRDGLFVRADFLLIEMTDDAIKANLVYWALLLKHIVDRHFDRRRI